MHVAVESSYLTDVERVLCLKEACERYGLTLWWSGNEKFLCSLHDLFPTKDGRTVVLPFLYRLELLASEAADRPVRVSPPTPFSEYEDLAVLLAFAAKQWDAQSASAVLFPQEWTYHQVETTTGPPAEVAVGEDLRGIKPEYLVQCMAPVEPLLRLALVATLRNLGGNVDDNHAHTFTFGDHFIERVGKLPVSVLPALLRSCAHTVLGLQMKQTHELRIKEQGGSPARRRTTDGAKGMRRDVYGKSHLHYWAAKVPEFAWVTLIHDDYTCPE